MGRAEVPPDEAGRLASLRELEILDTPAEQEFDDLAHLARSICATPIALLSLVDADRQWFKSRVGLDVTETHRDLSFCAHAILGEDIFVIPDATQDPRFSDNELVTGGPRIRFYAGAPLRLPDGHAMGTLSVIDYVPRDLTPSQHAMLLALKRQAEANLALRVHRRALRCANAALVDLQAKKSALVQFVVHDMKNALASVTLNAEVLATDPVAPAQVSEIGRDIASAAGVLNRLVTNIMDIGKTEAGGELTVVRSSVDLDSLLASIAKSFEGRLRTERVTLGHPPSKLTVNADRTLLERVLENLLDNAIRYTGPSTMVTISAERRGGETTIRVRDEGPGVDASKLESLFDMYAQGETGRAGTSGIGLAFCRLAVTAHGGRIWVESHGRDGTSFCVTLA